jgi:hypothetical protein
VADVIFTSISGVVAVSSSDDRLMLALGCGAVDKRAF